MNRKDKIIEILNPNILNPPIQANLSGQISKQNDKFTQSSILSLSKSAKIQIPKSLRTPLSIPSPVLTIQVFIPYPKFFSIELVIYDSSKTRRKILFTHCNSLKKDTIQAKLPTNRLPKDCWVNINIDLLSLSIWCFSHSFEELNSVSVSGSIKIRRIFAGVKANENDLPSGFQLPAASKNFLFDAGYFEGFSLEKKKVFDENLFVKKGDLRGMSANNKSTAVIGNGRYSTTVRKQLKPIEKVDSFYENAFNSIKGIRHSTPPFVRINKEALFYDPICMAYVN